MKLTKIAAISLLSLTMLTGCGASFDISPSTIQNYADSNSGQYANLTSDYSNYSYVEGAYVAETKDVHIELQDLDSIENASAWYKTNVEKLKENASSYSGSSNSKGGNYTIKTKDVYYRILFSKDKGIYAYGEKDAVESALKDMNISD